MSQRIIKGIGAAVLALTLSVSMAACSGGDKPSKDEYHAALTEMLGGEDTPKAVIDCMVDESYDDLSAEAVQAIVDGDEEAQETKSDEKVLEDATTACIAKMLE